MKLHLFGLLLALCTFLPLFGMEEQPEKKAKTEELFQETFQPKSLRDITASLAFRLLPGQTHLDECLPLVPSDIIERYINEPIDCTRRTPIFFVTEENIPTMMQQNAQIDPGKDFEDNSLCDYFIKEGNFKAALSIAFAIDDKDLNIEGRKCTVIADNLMTIGNKNSKNMHPADRIHCRKLSQEISEEVFAEDPNAVKARDAVCALLKIFASYQDMLLYNESGMPCSFTGKTALHLAQSPEEIKQALEVGYDINTQDIWGNTPLLYQVKQNRPHCAKTLLAAGANADIPDSHGTFPIEYAVPFGHNKLLPSLLTETVKQKISNSSLRLLESAVCHNNNGAMHLLLEHTTIDHTIKEWALFRSLYDGNLYGTQLLLNEEDVDVNAEEQGVENPQTLLMKAVKFLPDAVPLFLAHKDIDINLEDQKGNSALSIAVVMNNFSVFKQIMTCEQKLQNILPLHLSINENFIAGLEYLLANKADITEVNSKGCTVLHYAAALKNHKCLRLLLAHINRHYFERKSDLINQKVAKIDDPDRYEEETPLDIALSMFNPKGVKLLLNAGAVYLPSYLVSEDYLNPLFMLYDSLDLPKDYQHFIQKKKEQKPLVKKYNKIIDTFIQYGYNLDEADKNNHTVLTLAIRYMVPKVVKHVIDLGAKKPSLERVHELFDAYNKDIWYFLEEKSLNDNDKKAILSFIEKQQHKILSYLKQENSK